MNITHYDYVTVASEYQTVDLIVWKHYRVQARGLAEATMDANPHLAEYHREGPFIPVGVQLRIPIDPDVFAGRPQPVEVNTIAGPVL